MKRHPVFVACLLMATLLILPATPAAAQSRMNDKDIQQIMDNLKNDSKKFVDSFKSSVGKSSIRKTQQEKDARKLVDQSKKESEKLFKKFKDKKRADTEVQQVLSLGGRVDQLVQSAGLDSKTNDNWARVKGELDALNTAFGPGTP